MTSRCKRVGLTELDDFAASLLEELSIPVIVGLTGSLGAGKTTLVQAIGRVLGINASITSPTFDLIRRYDAPSGITLVHMDLYRLSGGKDAANLDLEYYLGPRTIALIEWPDRLEGSVVPDAVLELRLTDEFDCRDITLTKISRETE